MADRPETTDDDALRRTVHAALHADERFSSQAVEVEVSDGRVTLSGVVQSFRRKLAAQQAAAAACSAPVENRIEVSPPNNPADEDVAEDVRALFEQDGRLLQHAIVVEVRAGRVVLSGSVATDEGRALAEDVALQAPGARQVINQLVIDPAARSESLVVGSELEHTLANDPELAGCELRVAISGDVAVLSGTASIRQQLARAEALIRRAWVGELRLEATLD